MTVTTVISLLFLSLGLILIAVFLFYKKCYRFWDDHGIVHTKPTFPLGDATRSLTHRVNMGETITHVYSQFRDQPFVGFWLLFRPALLVRDPELIKDILVRDFMSCHDRGIYANEKKEPLTGTLFMISGQKWKNLRVKLTPTFTSGKMKMMFPIMEGCAKLFTAALENELADNEIVEMKEWSARYATDVISLCAFGIDANSLKNPNAEFRANGAKMLAPTLNNIIRLMINFLAPDVARWFQVRAFDKEASKYFLNAVRDTMDYRENTKTRRNDFMDLLVELRANGKVDNEKSETKSKNTSINTGEAAAQAFAFFIAGFETSSTTMIFALYELAKNPDIQNQVREEIDKVLQSNGGVISYDAVADMELLGRVVNESLRLYPVVPFLQRETSNDYQLSGTDKKLPKGTQIIIDVLGIHRDPVHYPAPEKFDPDRFLDEEKAKRHNYSFLPFGEGPRNCIGMRFGLVQVKLGIMSMVQNFEFSVCSKTPIPMKIDHRSFIMTPDGGMHLKATKINKARTV